MSSRPLSVKLILTALLFSFLVCGAEQKLASNTLEFDVLGGTHEGHYGGVIDTKLTKIHVQKAGQTTILTLRVVHQRPDRSTVSFSTTTQFQGELGVIDLKGTLSQVGVLPETSSHNNGEYFTVNAGMGEGQLRLNSLDAKRGHASGSFTLTQGEVTAKGSFSVTP